MENELLEMVAAVQHDEIWAHWMRYVFSICPLTTDGSVIIPPDKVERWKRQAETAYSDLTDKEKESDRDQAEKVINCFGTWLMHKNR